MKYLGLISRALNKARRELDIPVNFNPVSLVEKPKERPKVDRTLDEEKWLRLIEYASKTNFEVQGKLKNQHMKEGKLTHYPNRKRRPLYFMKQITIFARETLMRQGEIFNLKRKDANNLVLHKCNKKNLINTQTGFDYNPGTFGKELKGAMYKFCYLRTPFLENEPTNDMKEHIKIKLKEIVDHRKSIVAKNLKKQEEEKLAIENEKKIEQENKQEQQLASIIQKQQTCETLGFEIGKESNGECVLKLMQMEIDLNKIEEEKTVYVQSGDSNKTAEALAKQALRQQEMNSSLMLMQQGLNLMKPKPRINCNTTLAGWTCY
jgi:hypothetical protein